MCLILLTCTECLAQPCTCHLPLLTLYLGPSPYCLIHLHTGKMGFSPSGMIYKDLQPTYQLPQCVPGKSHFPWDRTALECWSLTCDTPYSLESFSFPTSPFKTQSNSQSIQMNTPICYLILYPDSSLNPSQARPALRALYTWSSLNQTGHLLLCLVTCV